MPRATSTEEIKLIESIITAHSGGIGIAAIEAEMARRQGDKPNRRTLQRRLQKLVDEQRVITEGESVALVYKRVPDSAVPEISWAACWWISHGPRRSWKAIPTAGSTLRT